MTVSSREIFPQNLLREIAVMVKIKKRRPTMQKKPKKIGNMQERQLLREPSKR